MRTLFMVVASLVLLSFTPARVLSQVDVSQADGSGIQELRHRQKEDRKALRLQQKAVKQAMRGHPHSAAERRQVKRQMRADRKFLRAGQRDAMISAKVQQKAAKKDVDGLSF